MFCIKCGTPVNISSVPNTPPTAEGFSTVTPEQMRVDTAQGIANQPYANTQANWQNPPQTTGLQNKKNTKRNVLIAVAGVALVLAVVLIAGVFLNSSNSQQQNANIDDLIKSGDDARNRKDYDRAIADYTQAIRLDPKNAEVYYNRGFAYVCSDKGDYNRAIADYTKAIQLGFDPLVWAYDSRASAYRKKGDYNRAIADYNKALQLDPDNKRGRYLHDRAKVYMEKGDYNRAVEDLEANLQLEKSLLESSRNDKTRSAENIRLQEAMVSVYEDELQKVRQEAKQKRGW